MHRCCGAGNRAVAVDYAPVMAPSSLADGCASSRPKRRQRRWWRRVDPPRWRRASLEGARPRILTCANNAEKNVRLPLFIFLVAGDAHLIRQIAKTLPKNIADTRARAHEDPISGLGRRRRRSWSPHSWSHRTDDCPPCKFQRGHRQDPTNVLHSAIFRH